MLLKATSMALAESAIEVLYRGKKEYATIVNASTSGTLVISVGVSDVSLAQAKTNMVTAFTSVSASTLDDVVVAIKNISGGTIGADTEISIGDFDCRIKNGLPTDTVYNAATDIFEDEAGTAQNLKGYDGGWFQTLVWDNDVDNVTGFCTLRLPPPAEGQGCVALRQITGMMGTTAGAAITNGISRTIYDADGNVLWTVSDATPTSSEMAFNLNEPIVWTNGPIIIRDAVLTGTDASEVNTVSTVAAWGYPPNVTD